MKAERRHELQDNELAKVIKKAPTFWQESGGKLLALCVALLVIVVLVRYRVSSNREAAQQAVQDLANARATIAELQGMRGYIAMAPPELMSQQQRQLFNDANNMISNAIGMSDERKIQAEALIAKGDLNYTLAGMPQVQGAATQPLLVIREPKELLEQSSEAYRTVVNNYADQKYAVIAARFGLAAIAENRGDFDAAKTQYDQLVLETKDMQAYQQMASLRLNMLDQLRARPVMGQPTTLPSLAGLNDLPTTVGASIPDILRPATQNVVAATQEAATRPAAAATTAPANPQAAVATSPTTQPS